jgi:phosphate acyltransferase
MRIAIDAMGGDHAPQVIVEGAVAAARDFGVEVILVGQEEVIRRCFTSGNSGALASGSAGGQLPPGVSIHHASQVVEMGEEPIVARRKKPDSSCAVATQLHADGKADAVLSAGNTGVAATEALFRLKRIPGIERPGIATVFPTATHPCVVIDTGANAECRPKHLADFAVLGAAYVHTVSGIIPGIDAKPHGELPTVGLLSIGEEETKGNDLTKASFKLLKENADKGRYQFFGNVEGRDISYGTVDVVVCDGFVGNVVLKVAEGFAKTFGGELKKALMRDARSKAGALLLKPSLEKFKARFDYTGFGGAALLGVNGVCIIRRFASPSKFPKRALLNIFATPSRRRPLKM